MRQNKSPWLHNFNYERKIKQLVGSVYTDIAVLGGGISGASTAFALLKYTDKKVCLIEGDLVAHGATGHNAGYVEAEFEKPFKEIVKEYGLNIARNGKYEIDNAWDFFFEMYDTLNLPKPGFTKSHKTYLSKEYFIEAIQEEYLKYGELKKEIFLDESCGWIDFVPENFKNKIKLISKKEILNTLELHNDNLGFCGLITAKIVVANSALLTEELVKYCQQKYPERFEVYEKSFVNSVRLLQNTNVVLDSLRGVCVADKIIICTNGFENYKIYGPIGSEIDSDFHHNVSGLIGYMMATFVNKSSIDSGGKFYAKDKVEKKDILDVEPYIYFTKRNFKHDLLSGELLSLGGPEVKLHDRRIYKKDHEFDENIYNELEKFQKNILEVNEKPIFKWHGLMGYTKTNIRIVGQDKKFMDLFYNLGCNGIGIIPSVAGAKRIARLINGEKLPTSIFDPK